MNRSHCETWQGRMGFDALGKLSEREHEELVQHLSGCAACRQIHDELVETTAALSSIVADPRQPEMAVSPALADAVLGSLEREGRSSRRHRSRFLVLATGAVAAVSIGVALLVSTVTTTPETSRTLALTGRPGASAQAVLVSKPWGTAMTFSEHGLPVNRTYTVAMATRSGRWWVAGTYRSRRGVAVTATMTCATQLGSIREIRVTDASGHELLANY